MRILRVGRLFSGSGTAGQVYEAFFSGLIRVGSKICAGGLGYQKAFVLPFFCPRHYKGFLVWETPKQQTRVVGHRIKPLNPKP